MTTSHLVLHSPDHDSVSQFNQSICSTISLIPTAPVKDTFILVKQRRCRTPQSSTDCKYIYPNTSTEFILLGLSLSYGRLSCLLYAFPFVSSDSGSNSSSIFLLIFEPANLCLNFDSDF